MKKGKSKVKGLFLPPADTGTVHPRGVSAITICNERGRHWGIGTCRWFWRGSKISARCSAWSEREKQKQYHWLLQSTDPIQCLGFLLNKQTNSLSCASWFIPGSPELRQLRQDYKLEAILFYTERGKWKGKAVSILSDCDYKSPVFIL